MDASAIALIRMILFAVILFCIAKSFFPRRGLKEKELYFEFCDLRRELTFMAITGEIKVTSISFEFFMRFLSDIIHYSDDYAFGTQMFFRGIYRNNKDLATEKFLNKLIKDVKKQGKQFEEFEYKVFNIVIRAFEKNSFLRLVTRVSFMYIIFNTIIFSKIFKKKRGTSLAYATDAVINIRTSFKDACMV